jgi:hypothetical protein
MRLDSLFPPQKVLQLILRNQIELPYEFGRENAAKKSTRCCHFRDLGKFRRAKTALHSNLRALFEPLRGGIRAWSKNKVCCTPLKLKLY